MVIDEVSSMNTYFLLAECFSWFQASEEKPAPPAPPKPEDW